ncbi:MAG: HAD hydrolase family protein, partial [Pseudomonadota bacterium]
SDLDGTLLDHDTYSFEAALPALSILREHGAALILASSKTAAEIDTLRTELKFEHCPAIVENGAGVLEPGQTASELGDGTYQDIRAILNEVPERLSQNFEGFGDCTASRVSSLTGLSLSGAERAKSRGFSEPGLWTGSQDEKREFLDWLAAKGLTARQGGRFLTMSFGTTKADQLFKIASRFAPAPILALGDAPNDIEMLEAANYAVIVKNEHGSGITELKQETTKSVVRTDDEGPAGWNSAVIATIERLGLDTFAK